jgi:hypothetical protein
MTELIAVGLLAVIVFGLCWVASFFGWLHHTMTNRPDQKTEKTKKQRQ